MTTTLEHKVVDPFSTPERIQLRETVRRFVRKDIVPNIALWERDQEIPRALHKQAAGLGLLGIGFDGELGASGGNPIDAIVVTEGSSRPVARAALLRADDPRDRDSAHHRRGKPGPR